MKTLYLWILFVLLLTGCYTADPKMSLHQKVQQDRSQPYTIYNYPSIYLISSEQQARARIQAEFIRNHIEVGMSEVDIVGFWGNPNDIKKSTYPDGTFDTFIYESTGGRYLPTENYYFIFRDNLLESWHRL